MRLWRSMPQPVHMSMDRLLCTTLSETQLGGIKRNSQPHAAVYGWCSAYCPAQSARTVLLALHKVHGEADIRALLRRRLCIS